MLLAAANAGEAFPMVPAPHPFRPYSQKVPRSTIAPGHPEIIYTGTLLHEDVAILDANEITLHEFLSDLHGVKAAPLRTLSATIHILRPFSTVSSSRMRPTNVSSSPTHMAA